MPFDSNQVFAQYQVPCFNAGIEVHKCFFLYSNNICECALTCGNEYSCREQSDLLLCQLQCTQTLGKVKHGTH